MSGQVLALREMLRKKRRRYIELGVTRERRLQEDKKIKIENARALFGLVGDLRDWGYNSVEIRKIIHSVDRKQDKLLGFAEQGKIHGAKGGRAGRPVARR